MMIYDVRAVQAHDKMLGRHFKAFDKATSGRPAKRNRKAIVRVGSGTMVGLSAEDIRNLKESAGRRGYAVPRFNPRTGRMLTAQWKSWKKLQRNRLAEIEGSGEAEDLVITPAGRMALKQPNAKVSHVPPNGNKTQ
jgi:hypothetical protein